NENKPVEPFIVHNNIEKVKIYPNPTRGNLVIESRKPLKQVFITDFAGKILMNLAMNPKQNQWKADITQYPAGTYMVKYVTTGNEWGAEKILLMH
ncbi:MAG TPA: T9SS type A sorting domain-containing protein, partial [Chitinophagaceae bacterium]